MDIVITGRKLTVSDAQKEYAEKKIEKLDTYFTQLTDAHVILYLEKLDHGAEVLINGDGVQFHGREKAADFFSAIDLLMDKMESQIKKYKSKHSQHRGAGEKETIQFDISDEPGPDVTLRQASTKPLDRIEAYLVMKQDNLDFFLFRMGSKTIEGGVDYANKNYAVLYRIGEEVRHAEPDQSKMTIRPFECSSIHEYILDVKDENPAHPEVDYNRIDGCSVRLMTLDDAIDELEKKNLSFLPFYNTETQYFNVVRGTQGKYEVIVPAF